MKNLTIIISTIIGSVIGYTLYPIINSTDSDEQKSTTIILEDTSNIAESVTSPKAQKVIAPSNTAEIKTESTKLQAHDIDNEGSYLTNSKAETIISESEPDSFELTELKQWAIVQEETILNILDEHLPESIKEKFIENVFSKSNFLNSPSIKQDPFIDYDWALAMEERLKIIYSQKEYKDGFELFSVDCKQLTCELFGNEKINGTFLKILNSLFKDPILMKILIPSEMTGQPMTGGDDNTNFIYFKIGFKPQA
jgi:hypothetical protein